MLILTGLQLVMLLQILVNIFYQIDANIIFLISVELQLSTENIYSNVEHAENILL